MFSEKMLHLNDNCYKKFKDDLEKIMSNDSNEKMDNAFITNLLKLRKK